MLIKGDDNVKVKDEVDEIVISDKEKNELVQATILSPIIKSQENIIQDLIEADTKDEVNKQLELFNLTLAKKNAIRMMKISNLMDKVDDEMVVRTEKRPDQISNRELIDMSNALTSQFEKSNNFNKSVLSEPEDEIKIKHQTNQLNININDNLSRDNKENIMNALGPLFNQLKEKLNKSNDSSDDSTETVEAEIIESEKSEDNIVYNNVENTNTDENKGE